MLLVWDSAALLETNEYYLVRTTTCDASRFESIAKLDPNNPDERVVMDEIVSMLSNGDFDLEDQTDNNVNPDL